MDPRTDQTRTRVQRFAEVGTAAEAIRSMEEEGEEFGTDKRLRILQQTLIAMLRDDPEALVQVSFGRGTSAAGNVEYTAALAYLQSPGPD